MVKHFVQPSVVCCLPFYGNRALFPRSSFQSSSEYRCLLLLGISLESRNVCQPWPWRYLEGVDDELNRNVLTRKVQLLVRGERDVPMCMRWIESQSSSLA